MGEALFNKKVLRRLAALYFIYHAVGVAAYNFPRNTALGDEPRFLFKYYIGYTGQYQPFDPFKSIDPWHKFSFSLVATNKEGEEREFGAILPGLRPIEGLGKLRIRVLFQRVVSKRARKRRLIPAYARLACKVIAENTDFVPEKITVRFDTERVRTLEEIRKDGVIGKEFVFKRGPYKCFPKKKEVKGAKAT